MAKKMKSSRKEGVKRLQKGPKRARETENQKKMLRKLVERIAKEIPEIKIGEEVRRMQKMERGLWLHLRGAMQPTQRKKKETVELSEEFENLKLVEEKIKSTIQNARKKEKE
jgi:hypothetical protein